MDCVNSDFEPYIKRTQMTRVTRIFADNLLKFLPHSFIKTNQHECRDLLM